MTIVAIAMPKEWLLLATWLAISAMAFIEALSTLWPLPCDHCSVPGGNVDDFNAGGSRQCRLFHKRVKEQLRLWKALQPRPSFPELVARARCITHPAERAALLERLSTRVVSRNVWHCALQTESNISWDLYFSECAAE